VSSDDKKSTAAGGGSAGQPGGEFRGPIGGHGPDPARPPAGVWSWGWGPGWGAQPVASGRRRLPWLGIFLVLFGGLLLVEQLIPGARVAASAVVVVAGAALLVSWAINHGTWALYGGALLIAIGLPPALEEAGIIRPGAGWDTLFLGIAFLFIAIVRWASRGGLGWQAVLGGILVLIGGSQVAQRELPGIPSLDHVFWPAAILVIGLWILWRALRQSH